MPPRDPPASAEPLVSVVTPFYNTADYLPECIESVLRQSYQNWEYLLVDNCSTDGSRDIAERYARQDPRIRVCANPEFVGQDENYNGALLHISPHSVYCKMVEADNWIFPRCLEKMVGVAQANPRVDVVGSHYVQGPDAASASVIRAQGRLPETMDGRSACRMHLLDHAPLFGSPTNVLLRSSIVRGRKPFFDVTSRHCDREVCYDVLQDRDFGYVDEVLAFIRDREQSVTAGLTGLGTYHLYRLVLVRRHGRSLFPDERDFQRYGKRVEREYCAALLKHLVRSPNRREIWRTHAGVLARIGYNLSWRRLIQASPAALSQRLLRTGASRLHALVHGGAGGSGRAR